MNVLCPSPALSLTLTLKKDGDQRWATCPRNVPHTLKILIVLELSPKHSKFSPTTKTLPGRRKFVLLVSKTTFCAD